MKFEISSTTLDLFPPEKGMSYTFSKKLKTDVSWTGYATLQTQYILNNLSMAHVRLLSSSGMVPLSFSDTMMYCAVELGAPKQTMRALGFNQEIS